MTPGQGSVFPNGESAASAGSAVAVVYCDGACIGNPGPGGYGVVVQMPNSPDIVDSGGLARTTNNQMELTAAIVGLTHALERGARIVRVVSDSEYVVKGMNGWVAGWKRKGWKTSTGTPVKNQEMWAELDVLCTGRNVTWQWIPGHAGYKQNEQCDRLAVAAAKLAASRPVAGPQPPARRSATGGRTSRGAG